MGHIHTQQAAASMSQSSSSWVAAVLQRGMQVTTSTSTRSTAAVTRMLNTAAAACHMLRTTNAATQMLRMAAAAISMLTTAAAGTHMMSIAVAGTRLLRTVAAQLGLRRGSPSTDLAATTTTPTAAAVDTHCTRLCMCCPAAAVLRAAAVRTNSSTLDLSQVAQATAVTITVWKTARALCRQGQLTMQLLQTSTAAMDTTARAVHAALMQMLVLCVPPSTLTTISLTLSSRGTHTMVLQHTAM